MSYMPLRAEITVDAQLPSETSTSSLRKRTLTESTRQSRSPRRSSRQAATSNGNHSAYPIIVHCHLCWDWVWQRPQQFLSRLSRKHPILFVETVGPDPSLAAASARYYKPEAFPNITVLRLQFPTWCWSNGDYVDRERRRIVKSFIRGPLAGQFDEPVQWFYDPMAVRAFAGHMNEVLTVYDCMDELSKFRFAPPEIVDREADLLARADVVFTGGRKLFESKSAENDNCHFYGCGVDVEHFGRALKAETAIPDALARLPKPVYGYFGVIDERLDYELLAQLAEAVGTGSVAMIGPVMKVDENTLPKHPHLHWLGKQHYDDLPAFCRGFDVCLMPFALNESTEFINPTKTLEYMATGRPIVSTAVPDVVRNFGHIVQVAASPEEFVAQCVKAAGQPDGEAIEAGLKTVQEHTWDSIVQQLERHIEEAMVQRIG